MEECVELTELRREVEKEEMVEWTRHSRNRKRKKGDVGVENEKQKQEGEKMERFSNAGYEFLTDFNSSDATNFLYNLQSDSG